MKQASSPEQASKRLKSSIPPPELPVRLAKYLSDHTPQTRKQVAKAFARREIRLCVPVQYRALYDEMNQGSHTKLPSEDGAEGMADLLSLVCTSPSRQGEEASFFVPPGFWEVGNFDLGSFVYPDEDQIYFQGQLVARELAQTHHYLAFHKPKGFLTSTAELGAKAGLESFMEQLPAGVMPVGRLDRATTGLLLMTNDGSLAFSIIKKGNPVEKEYHLTIAQSGLTLADPRFARLLKGVDLADGPARALTIGVFRGQPQQGEEALGITHVSLTISEGRNRIVRRMCQAVDLPLLHLHRVRIGPVTLSGTEEGANNVVWDVKSALSDPNASPSPSDMRSAALSELKDKEDKHVRWSLPKETKKIVTKIVNDNNSTVHEIYGSWVVPPGGFRSLSCQEVDALQKLARSTDDAVPPEMQALLDRAQRSRHTLKCPDLRLEDVLRRHGVTMF